jgi:patatin-like phospholipase/acyl hydrolase
MKGYITCVILEELERKTQKKCHEIFDFMAGTSVGGILAALLSSGFPASEALKFFTEDGPKIFKKTWKNRIIGGVFTPKYSSDAVETVLKERLSGLIPKTDLLITSYDITMQQPHFFNFKANLRDTPYDLWQAARATSAAQIYFPAFQTYISGQEHVFWDGGNVANNPAMCAYAEFLNLYSTDPVILSIGTGTGVSKIEAESFIKTGFIKNAIFTLTSLFQAGSEEVDYQLSQLLNNDYHRIQPISPLDFAMDGAETSDLQKLYNFSQDFVDSEICQNSLNNFIKKLK